MVKFLEQDSVVVCSSDISCSYDRVANEKKLATPISYMNRVTFSKNYCGVGMKQNHFEVVNEKILFGNLVQIGKNGHVTKIFLQQFMSLDRGLLVFSSLFIASTCSTTQLQTRVS